MSSTKHVTSLSESAESHSRQSILHPPYILCDDIDFPLRSPPSLCHFCQAIIDQWERLVTKSLRRRRLLLDHYSTISDLQQSAERGCGLCSQFKSGESFPHSLLTPYSERLEDEENKNGGFVRFCAWTGKDNMLELTIPRPVEQSCFDNDCFEFNISMVRTKRLAIEYDARNFPPSTLDGLPLCKKWLQDCRDSHERCREAAGQYHTPTRLLYLKGTTVQLQETTDTMKSVTYATLSHCWGGKDFLRLLRYKLEEFRIAIPHDDLPKTFQDAIFIARYLGFDYLWIDSLCIIQDDSGDWERESTLMTDVYGGSSLNIAAVSAEDGSVGCFFQRSRTWRTQITTKKKSWRTWLSMYKKVKYRKYDVIPTPLLHSKPSRTPLFERGWVVQERYLPIRTLYFHEHEIFWDCHEKTFCESTLQAPMSFSSTRSMSRQNWHEIVGAYSQMSLTKRSDKLVAIGGLAKVLQSQSGDGYIAGLWRQNFEVQLLWSAYMPQRQKDEIGVAPSWSWASVDCRVYYSDKPDSNHTVELLIQLHTFSIDLVASNPFGRIQSGTIRLSCKYLFSNTTSWDGKHSPVYLLLGGVELKLNLVLDSGRSRGTPWVVDDASIILEDDGEPRISHEGSGCIENKEQQKAVAFHFLPVSFGNTHRGLLLEATKEKRGQYRRVGIYYFYDAKGDQACLQAAKPIAEDCAELSVNDDGETTYMIDII